MRGTVLFDKIVGMCGVPAVLAPGIVRRALLDVKVRPQWAQASDYRAALPRLERRIAAYVPSAEAARMAAAIAEVLEEIEAGGARDGSTRVIEVDPRAALRQSGERTREGAVELAAGETVRRR